LARKRAGCRAERRRPALADDIFQVFIGPMFFVAKVLVALGFRRDLAEVLNGGGDGVTERTRMELKAQSPSAHSKQS
jgi:uncharacterized membrane protein YGL010W